MNSRKDRQALALVTLLRHPEWTDEQIAEAAEVSRRQLYRWPAYARLKQLLRGTRRDAVRDGRLPRGVKNGTSGVLEAYREDGDERS
jgi:hypothetical protein